MPPPVIDDERVNLHLRTRKAVIEWIEAVLNIKLEDDLQKSLRTGVILCYLMQEIEERSIPRIQEHTQADWRLKENIHFFLLALTDYGIGKHRIFLLADLFENKNMVSVVESLAELARVANSRGFRPLFEVKPNAPIPNITPAERKLLKEQLAKLKEKAVERGRVKVSAEIVRRKLQVLGGQGIDWVKFEKNLAKFQALVRGHRARKRFQVMVRDVAYRVNVAKEILETEKSYVNSLSACIKFYMNPLDELTKGKLVTKDDIRVVFSNIQIIYAFHEQLLAELEPRVQKWSQRQCLGDIFLKIISYLKVYTDYLQNFNDSNTRLHNLMRNDKVSKVLEDYKQNVPGRLDLPSLLIMPVQRVPRYNLLLKDLAKHTWPEHPDYEKLNELVEKIAEIAGFLNAKKKEAENMNKLLFLTDRITRLPMGVIIPEPHRRLVAEHTLLGDQKRVLYVFNDMLLLGKPSGTTSFSKRDIKYKDHFYYLSVTLKDAPDEKNLPNIIVVERDGHKKPTKLPLPTPAAKADILNGYNEQRAAMEQLALEKKREMQQQHKVITGQTNEEILHNRKKKSLQDKAELKHPGGTPGNAPVPSTSATNTSSGDFNRSRKGSLLAPAQKDTITSANNSSPGHSPAGGRFNTERKSLPAGTSLSPAPAQAQGQAAVPSTSTPPPTSTVVAAPPASPTPALANDKKKKKGFMSGLLTRDKEKDKEGSPTEKKAQSLIVTSENTDTKDTKSKKK